MKKFTGDISKELQNTVLNGAHINKVYWDLNGKHYFNVHSLPESQDNKTESLYGAGLYSHNQVIPGKTNVDNLTEILPKGDSSTKIVSELTREEVLDYEVKKDDDSISTRILNSTSEEKNATLAALGFTPAMLEAFAKMSEGKTEDKNQQLY